MANASKAVYHQTNLQTMTYQLTRWHPDVSEIQFIADQLARAGRPWRIGSFRGKVAVFTNDVTDADFDVKLAARMRRVYRRNGIALIDGRV